MLIEMEIILSKYKFIVECQIKILFHFQSAPLTLAPFLIKTIKVIKSLFLRNRYWITHRFLQLCFSQLRSQTPAPKTSPSPDLPPPAPPLLAPFQFKAVQMILSLYNFRREQVLSFAPTILLQAPLSDKI